VQALGRMMQMNQNETLSWFQIGGIHGLPYTAWDSSSSLSGGKFSNTGYCTHSSVLFPTWHRPYVALFEQALQAQAKEIATEYTTDRSGWEEAAATLRSPFWDWAHYAIPPPEVYDIEKFQNVTITTPQGTKEFPNTLLGYRFHPIDSSFGGDFSKWENTTRWPDDNGVPQPQRMLNALQGANNQTADSLRKQTFGVITMISDWVRFSNNNPQQRLTRIPINSLETIHDSIHGRTGGNGHMGAVPYAAFDPLFWLHHTNVDRIFALWQSLHPKTWVAGRSESGTFNIPTGQKDENTDLTPFWKGPDSYHKSSSPATREWGQLHYTYPEYVGLEGLPEEQVSAAIRHKVDILYNPENPRPAVRADAVDAVLSAAPPDAPHPPDHIDWSIQVRSKRFALKESYTVYFFFGAPPTSGSPDDWLLAENQVGSFFEFVNSFPELCENCLENIEVITDGYIPILDHLKKRKIDITSHEATDKFLKEQLHWSVVKVDGTVVPNDSDELKDLEVVVVSTPLTFSRLSKRWELRENGSMTVRPSVAMAR